MHKTIQKISVLNAEAENVQQKHGNRDYLKERLITTGKGSSLRQNFCSRNILKIKKFTENLLRRVFIIFAALQLKILEKISVLNNLFSSEIDFRERTKRLGIAQQVKLLRESRGAVTAEYAIVIMAAVAFAGLLVVIMRSSEVQAILTKLVENALNTGS